MMRRYIGTPKVVCAEPQIKLGQPGFVLIYDDGYKAWIGTKVFERSFREMSEGEIDLIFTEGALAEK